LQIFWAAISNLANYLYSLFLALYPAGSIWRGKGVFLPTKNADKLLETALLANTLHRERN
jgi:hypothetical protein